MLKILGAATAVAMLASAAASAAPVTVNPGNLVATGGDVKAIFMYQDAGNTSLLNLVSFGGNPIFNNHTDPFGKTVDLGVLAGGQVFNLHNVTTSTDFYTGQLAADGYYHAIYSTNYATFGDPLPAASAAAIAALPPGTSVIYVAFEDKLGSQGGDYDYNDLVFAFTNTTTTVPEPLSMALLGSGLVALGLARRARG